MRSSFDEDLRHCPGCGGRTEEAHDCNLRASAILAGHLERGEVESLIDFVCATDVPHTRLLLEAGGPGQLFEIARLILRRGSREPRTAFALEALGWTLYGIPEPEGASPGSVEACLRGSLSIQREILPPGHQDLACVLINVAHCIESRQGDEALALMREAAGLLRAGGGPDYYEAQADVAHLLAKRARRLFETGASGGEELFGEASSLIEELLGLRASFGPEEESIWIVRTLADATHALVEASAARAAAVPADPAARRALAHWTERCAPLRSILRAAAAEPGAAAPIVAAAARALARVEPKRAIELARQAVERTARMSSDFLDVLAFALMAGGDARGAAAAAREALDLETEDSAYRQDLSRQVRRYEEAAQSA